ncbi:putative rhomboid-like transmembrane protein [Spiroplasma litorale]|uniref:Putative rhomboid-like transmembrane protein n=1 Tax=Spiroplasma litorale TaxID=216942 RepID=A0A0K1W0R7_9MOLU|nr:hypothetical protein [Spiroplasma litorale]AKX33920.1 putative rhomboid-like transmembrane protein [Spiroplasma litorale]
MKVDFNKLKLSLINYLIKVEKYKSIKDLSNEYVTYLINDKKEYKILRVTIGYPVSSDNNIVKLKENLKNAKREKINVLNIAFSLETDDVVVEGTTVIIENEEKLKDKLSVYFSRISKIKIESENENTSENIEELSNEELFDILSNPSKSDNIKLKTAVARMKSHSVNSTIMSILFLIMPVAIGIASFFYFNDYNFGAKDLFFGATNRNLTVIGNQWWRILTYGFTMDSYFLYGQILGAFIVVLISFTAIKLSKYTESLVGQWKFSVSIFATYIISGLFVSVLLPSNDAIFSGPMVILAAVVGTLCVTTWSKKADPVVLFSKNRLVFPIILLLLAPFIITKYNDYVIIIISLLTSASITLLFNYDWTNPDRYLIFPLFIIIAPTLVSIICVFLPVASPATDLNFSIEALQMYLKYGIFSQNQVNQILENNGWYCRFAENGSLWWF